MWTVNQEDGNKKSRQATHVHTMISMAHTFLNFSSQALFDRSTPLQKTRHRVFHQSQECEQEASGQENSDRLKFKKKIFLIRGPFLTSPLGANFDPQGRSCPPGVSLSPRGKVIPWG
jgi:hypothetical protein